jgi:hypothetical protein
MPRSELMNPPRRPGVIRGAARAPSPAEHDHILNPRRASRLRLRCLSRVTSGERTWDAETEDVGARGCQLVSSLAVPVGEVVQLVLSVAGTADLTVSGEVVWASASAPFRLGVAFAPHHAGATSRWFDDVARTGVGFRAERYVRDIPARATVFLRAPPQFCPDYTPAEAAVLVAIGAGLSAGALRDRFRTTWAETRHALFSLVARNIVTTSAREAVPLARWRGCQEHLEALAAEWRHQEDPAAEPARARPAPAQTLYEDAMVLVASGRSSSAIQALRSALAFAPGDPGIAAALLRIACNREHEAPPGEGPAALSRSGSPGSPGSRR